MTALSTRSQYLLWAARRILKDDRQCPWCAGRSRLVRRKMLVTELRQCLECGLRFRAPKDDDRVAETFYNTDYRQGFTTDCPGAEELARLIAARFAGSEKDYAGYVGVLEQLGLRAGSKILDFGCSWGYGSWQMSEAGFRVVSYEISRTRAQYARDHLGCAIVSDPLQAGRVDCLFAAHVLEHLASPQELWNVARAVLERDGVVVCFVPNGEAALEQLYGARRYHQLWGKVHPLLLNGSALREMAVYNGFEPRVYSSPYDSRLSSWRSDDALLGEELALIARQRDH